MHCICKTKRTFKYVKKLHSILKAGTSSEYNEYAPVGRYKVFENEVGQIATAAVDQVEETDLVKHFFDIIVIY